VGWLKSQLFWKITGLYALLSLLALIGLLVTLTTRMSGQAVARQQQTVQETLKQIQTELDAAEDPDAVLASWQKMLGRSGQPVWLLDREGRSLTTVAEVDEPPAEVTLQSVVLSAIRSGNAMRRIRLGSDKHESLAFALDVSVDPASPRVLLTVIDAGVSEQSVTAMNSAMIRAAVFTWMIGLLCIAFVAAGLVGPLQAMSLNLHQSTERVQREDMLLTISDRHDELGQVATSLHLLEEEREERISELQLAERTARSSADLLRAVLDSMIEGVVAIDLEQRIVFLNSGVRRLLGISNAIGVGHRLYEAVRVPAFLDTVKEAVASKTMQTLEYRAAREQIDLVLVVIPILKGSHPGAVAVVRDISEIRKIEAMRRDFVSGVSHELKTPLTVIQACTDTLLEGAMADPVAAQRFLKQIEEQSERLLQLILGMLQLARVESGQQMLHIEPIDVVTVTDDILRGFQTLAEKKSVTLHFNGPEEMIVSADEQALQTILSNLVDNALKHTNPGGSVTIQLIGDSTPSSEFGPAIVVRDTGIGIPEDLLGRIFERFYRVERDRSRERGGSGLGLAIVKHLCQSLGATVSVKSEVGRGSEFCVQFRKA
jgi:two-component system phosphate regulon sensor histidine kinase PhoR